MPLLALIASLPMPAGGAEEHEAEFEIGGVAERSTASGPGHWGSSVALEIAPSESLELELGVSRIAHAGATEWQTEIVFKMPIERSEHTELMLGLAPTWTHATGLESRSDAFGAECSLDFQYWVGRRWGWFVEPGYGVAFQRGGEHPLSVTIGFLIAVP